MHQNVKAEEDLEIMIVNHPVEEAVMVVIAMLPNHVMVIEKNVHQDVAETMIRVFVSQEKKDVQNKELALNKKTKECVSIRLFL